MTKYQVTFSGYQRLTCTVEILADNPEEAVRKAEEGPQDDWVPDDGYWDSESEDVTVEEIPSDHSPVIETG